MTPPESVPQQEHRRTRRLPSKLETPCRLVSVAQEGNWPAVVRTISAEGIGLTVQRPVQPGMFLTLKLPLGPNRELRPRLIEVKHTGGPAGTDGCSVGAVFLKPLTPAELDAVRGQAPREVPQSGKRTAVRHVTDMNEPCPVVCVSEQGPWWAAVRNVSSRGLGLIVTRSFPPGSLLTIALPLPGRKLVVLRVANVRPQPGKRWLRLGGAFLQKLTTDELEALA
jgi:hypothetical protein